MRSAIVVIIHKIIQVNLQSLYALIMLLSESNRVELIQKRFIESLHIAIGPGMFHLGSSMLYPEFLVVGDSSFVVIPMKMCGLEIFNGSPLSFCFAYLNTFCVS